MWLKGALLIIWMVGLTIFFCELYKRKLHKKWREKYENQINHEVS